MDQSPASFIDRPVTDLPTPSLVLSKPVLEKNIQLLLQDVKQLGIAFRPHVKTLKVSYEIEPWTYADCPVNRSDPDDAGKWQPSQDRCIDVG